MEEDNQRLFASMLSSKASMSSSPLVQPLVEVQRVPRKGRCLVASRDVGAGTLLLAEDPFVLVAAGRHAPSSVSSSLCRFQGLHRSLSFSLPLSLHRSSSLPLPLCRCLSPLAFTCLFFASSFLSFPPSPPQTLLAALAPCKAKTSARSSNNLPWGVQPCSPEPRFGAGARPRFKVRNPAQIAVSPQ